MDADFFDTTIGEQVTLQRGFDITKKQQMPGEVPVVSSGGISSFHNEAKIQAPGVVLGRKGSLGTVFYLAEDYWPHDTTLWVKDFKNNNQKFVYYFFRNMADELKKMDVGAANPTLNRNHVHLLPTKWPSREIQDHIDDLVSVLDNKIQLNRETNQTLEVMAQALFKSWFVDFDPVIDNALAAGNEIPEPLQARAEQRKALYEGDDLLASRLEKAPAPLPEHIRQLFPRSFVFDAEMGWMPEGWEVKQIKDVARVIKGKSYKSSELADSKTALVSLKSFNRGGGYRLDGLKEYTGSYKPEQEVFAGDLIIAYTDVTQSADVIGKPGMVISDSRYEHLIVSLDVAVVRPQVNAHKYFLYGLTQTRPFQDHTHSHSTGTTVLHLSKDAVPDYYFSLPDQNVLDIYERMVKPNFESIDSNVGSTRTLVKLRDTLLPKLISGELRIPEAQQQLETAVA